MREIMSDGNKLVLPDTQQFATAEQQIRVKHGVKQQHKCREEYSSFSQHHHVTLRLFCNVHGERYEADVHRGGDNLERYVVDVKTGRDAFEDVSEHASGVALLVFQPLRLVFFRILLNDPKGTLE